MKKIKVLFLLLAILFGSIGTASAQYFEDCGVVEAGVEAGCYMFNSDHFGRYELMYFPEPPEVGAYLRIFGTLDTSGYYTWCMEGDGQLYEDSSRDCDFECDCLPADADGDGYVRIFDATYIINYLYLNGPEPTPYALCSADGNADCVVNLFDVLWVIYWLYLGGSYIYTCDEWLVHCGPPLR